MKTYRSDVAGNSPAGIVIAAAVMLVVTLALPAVPLLLAACRTCLLSR